MQYIKKFLNRVDSHGQLQIIGPADETVSKIARYVSKSNLYKAGGSPAAAAGKEQTGTIYRSKQRIQGNSDSAGF